MKELVIKVPELGKAPGTTADIAPKLQHILNTLSVTSTTDNEPALVFEHWSKKDENEEPRRVILMFYSPDQSIQYWYEHSGRVYSLFPEQDTYGGVYLFPALSETAFQIVDNFLKQLAKEFIEQYNKS